MMNKYDIYFNALSYICEKRPKTLKEVSINYNITDKKTIDFLIANFIDMELSKEQLELYDNMKLSKNYLLHLNNYNLEEKLNERLDLCMCVALICYFHDDCSINEIFLKYYYDYTNILDKIDFCEEIILEGLQDADVASFFDDENIIKISKRFNILKLGDFEKLSHEMIFVLYYDFLDLFFKPFDSYGKEINISFSYNHQEFEFDNHTINDEEVAYDLNDIYDVFNNKLSEREKLVLYSRIGLNNSFVEMTLEEVGKNLALTRERVRQIEKNAYKKISLRYKLKTIVHRLLKLINYTGYMSFEDISSLYGEYFTNMICCICSIDNINYHYDKKLGCIYDSNIFLNDSFYDSFVGEIGVAISPKKYENLSSFKKRIINYKYRYKDEEKLYFCKGYNKTDLICNLIDNNFPNGIRPGVADDYQKLISIYRNEYDCIDVLSQHTVAAMLQRSDYVLIDRGTYIKRDKVLPLNELLKTRIINYIESNKKNYVFYLDIYNHFNSDMIENGINNFYHLKGLIDPFLPKYYLSKRDYISKDGKEYTTLDTLSPLFREYRNSYEIFTFDDVASKASGIQDSAVFNALYAEQENGLVWISTNKYRYYPDSFINNYDKNELLSFVESTFNVLKLELIYSKKLFSRLKIKDPGLIERLDIESSYHLYYFMKRFFSDVYYFNNSYISKNVIGEITVDNLIIDYMNSHSYCEPSEINGFLNNVGARSVGSYLKLIDEFSDEFIQVNRSRIVKIDTVNIDKNVINTIDNLLTISLKTIDEFNTHSFVNYKFLPKVNGYEWNEYLIAGIVRTFLSDKYEVVADDLQYTLCNYIIKKRRF